MIYNAARGYCNLVSRSGEPAEQLQYNGLDSFSALAEKIHSRKPYIDRLYFILWQRDYSDKQKLTYFNNYSTHYIKNSDGGITIELTMNNGKTSVGLLDADVKFFLPITSGPDVTTARQ